MGKWRPVPLARRQGGAASEWREGHHTHQGCSGPGSRPEPVWAWTSDPIIVGMAGWDWAEEGRDSREYCVWRQQRVLCLENPECAVLGEEGKKVERKKERKGNWGGGGRRH